MVTVGEEIEAWTKDYKSGDKMHKFVLQNLAALEYFKAKKIWEFVKQQPKILPDEI